MCFSVKKIINLPVSVHVRLHDYTAGINVPADNITDSFLFSRCSSPLKVLHYVSLQNLQQSIEAEVTLSHRGIFIFQTRSIKGNQSQLSLFLFLCNTSMYL